MNKRLNGGRARVMIGVILACVWMSCGAWGQIETVTVDFADPTTRISDETVYVTRDTSGRLVLADQVNGEVLLADIMNSVTSHALLTGLGADDHTQYYNSTRLGTKLGSASANTGSAYVVLLPITGDVNAKTTIGEHVADAETHWKRPADALWVATAGGQYATIQSAINAASSGDVVWVFPGTYSEQITGKAGVHVCGVSRDKVRIAAGAAETYPPTWGNATVYNAAEGFTISGVTIANEATGFVAAAIWNAGSMVVRDCAVESAAGAAVYTATGGDLEIRGSEITADSAAYSAIYVVGGEALVDGSDVTVNGYPVGVTGTPTYTISNNRFMIPGTILWSSWPTGTRIEAGNLIFSTDGGVYLTGDLDTVYEVNARGISSIGAPVEVGNVTSGTLIYLDSDTGDAWFEGVVTAAGMNVDTLGVDDMEVSDTLTVGGAFQAGSVRSLGSLAVWDSEEGYIFTVDPDTLDVVALGALESLDSVTAPLVKATTFDTNVAAAGVTLAGVTLSADGTDTNIDINITPKGTGEVNLTKVDIDAGAIDGTAIGAGTPAAGSFTTCYATTFDTNVAAAGVTLAGVTLSADGTDTNIDINITPKGTGEVNLTKVDIDAGAIDGTAIGANSASTGKFSSLSVGTTTWLDYTTAGFVIEANWTHSGYYLYSEDSSGAAYYQLPLCPGTIITRIRGEAYSKDPDDRCYINIVRRQYGDGSGWTAVVSGFQHQAGGAETYNCTDFTITEGYIYAIQVSPDVSSLGNYVNLFSVGLETSLRGY